MTTRMAPAKDVGRHVLWSAVSVFFEYDTPKIVHIRSKRVGIINRLIQLIIIGYVIGYAIVYKKGYQDFDNVQSAVTTKVKGIIYVNGSAYDDRTWDVADYVIPPQEANAFFVVTHVIPTIGQSQTYCPEDTTIQEANCTDDPGVCVKAKGTIFPKGNGPANGDCVDSSIPGTKVCKIYGWCPVEDDSMDTPVFNQTANFTVFIKNNIEFSKFGVKRRNLRDDLFKNDTAFSNCRWNAHDPVMKYCPIFILKDITDAAGLNYLNLIQKGGVMQIVIDWTCNLDYSEDDCWPEYSFRRLDRGDFKISAGFNFRYADRYRIEENNKTLLYRDLYKAAGIRFLVTVQGKAGKFDLVNLMTNIGSGMALLGIATILSDLVVLYVLKARKFYKENKYLDVEGQDAFETWKRPGKTLEMEVLNEEEGNSDSNSARRRAEQDSSEHDEGDETGPSTAGVTMAPRTVFGGRAGPSYS